MRIKAYITLFFDPERNQTWSVCEECISSSVFKYRSNGKWPCPNTGELLYWADYSMSGRIKSGCIPVEVRAVSGTPFRLDDQEINQITGLIDDASIHEYLVGITNKK